MNQSIASQNTAKKLKNSELDETHTRIILAAEQKADLSRDLYTVTDYIVR